MGGSAGGLLMGAVYNMRPDLFAGLIAVVPFVDVVTTMLNESIPLTTSEYDEWGSPNEQAAYEYMLSYSPYDQVEAKDYPPMLVLTSLHDSQVQYWEPAKWVAKLRALKTDANPLLLRCKMEAGHGGVSGRYKRYRETAFQYAFLLDRARPTLRGADDGRPTTDDAPHSCGRRMTFDDSTERIQRKGARRQGCKALAYMNGDLRYPSILCVFAPLR